MLQDEDIVGQGDDEDEDDEAAAASALPVVPDKWKKLEADLQRIRDRESKRDELQQLRKALEESEKGGEGGKGSSSADALSKREQKQIRKAFKELDKLERDHFIADLQKRDQAKTEQKSLGSIVENQDHAAMSFDELKAMVPALRKQSR